MAGLKQGDTCRAGWSQLAQWCEQVVTVRFPDQESHADPAMRQAAGQATVSPWKAQVPSGKQVGSQAGGRLAHRHIIQNRIRYLLLRGEEERRESKREERRGQR